MNVSMAGTFYHIALLHWNNEFMPKILYFSEHEFILYAFKSQ